MINNGLVLVEDDRGGLTREIKKKRNLQRQEGVRNYVSRKNEGKVEV